MFGVTSILDAVEIHWYKWCLDRVIQVYNLNFSTNWTAILRQYFTRDVISDSVSQVRIGKSCPDVYLNLVNGRMDLLVTEQSDGVVNYKPGTGMYDSVSCTTLLSFRNVCPISLLSVQQLFKKRMPHW